MINLKKWSVCLLVALLLLGNVVLAADELAKPNVVVFTPPTSPPKSYVKDGKVTGMVVDLTIEAMKRAGYTAEMQTVPWARAVKSAEQGEGLITNFSHSLERDKLFNFSTEPIFHDTVVLVTRRDADFPFNGLKDLAGKTIGMMRGASHGPAVEAALPTFKDDRDQGTDQRLRKLIEGRIDGAAISTGRPGVYYHLKAAGIDPKQVIVHDVPIVVDPNYIALAKTYPNGTEILNRLNKAIVSMRADGTMAKILASYD